MYQISKGRTEEKKAQCGHIESSALLRLAEEGCCEYLRFTTVFSSSSISMLVDKQKKKNKAFILRRKIQFKICSIVQEIFSIF